MGLFDSNKCSRCGKTRGFRHGAFCGPYARPPLPPLPPLPPPSVAVRTAASGAESARAATPVADAATPVATPVAIEDEAAGDFDGAAAVNIGAAAARHGGTYRVHPVDINSETNTVERVATDAEATAWAVYAVDAEGCENWQADCTSRDVAEQLAAALGERKAVRS